MKSQFSTADENSVQHLHILRTNRIEKRRKTRYTSHSGATAQNLLFLIIKKKKYLFNIFQSFFFGRRYIHFVIVSDSIGFLVSRYSPLQHITATTTARVNIRFSVRDVLLSTIILLCVCMRTRKNCAIFIILAFLCNSSHNRRHCLHFICL